MKKGTFFSAFFAIAFTCIVILTAASAEAQVQPVFSDYRGVKINMTADEVRAKLGDPKDKVDSEDYFEASANESIRVVYDGEKKVNAIVVTYSGDLAAAPPPKAVVGTPIEAAADGRMYKMSQYPKAGFWISYVKTGGDNAMVIIMMQRMSADH